MIDKNLSYAYRYAEGGEVPSETSPAQEARKKYIALLEQGSDPYAAKALMMATGVIASDPRYALGDGKMVTAKDALQFQMAARGEPTDYDQAIAGIQGADQLFGLDGKPAGRPPEIPDFGPPELLPIPPGGDFGLPPQTPVVTPPVVTPRPGETLPIPPGGDFGLPPPGRRTYAPYTAPPVYTAPPAVMPSEQISGQNTPVMGYTPQVMYQPPAIPDPSAAGTRAAGYLANSPFVRPAGIESLQLGGIKLS